MRIHVIGEVFVDIDNVPATFEQQIYDAFSKFVRAWDASNIDKLIFIDQCIDNLHHNTMCGETAVKDLARQQFEQFLDNDELPNNNYFHSLEFMADCYFHGKNSRKLYAKYGDDFADDMKIMDILCRVIKVVFEYGSNRGKWIYDKNGGIVCSVCKNISYDCIKSSYCPECGAKMECEQEV